MSISFKLPWPSSKLSGHNKGHWRDKADIIAKCRSDAHYATKEAISGQAIPKGRIDLRVTFYPPDRRGDMINYPNRMKPYFDGIATGIMVNDKSFNIPEYHCTEPVENAHVLVEIKSITLRTDSESSMTKPNDLKRPNEGDQTPAKPKSNTLKPIERSAI